MPKVTFLPDNIQIEVPIGTSIQEAVERAGASLPFGCRMGSCGTCRCWIKEGIENLNELTEAERELFETLTSVGSKERLGCQLVVKGDVVVQS